jgi:hypothetical protein
MTESRLLASGVSHHVICTRFIENELHWTKDKQTGFICSFHVNQTTFCSLFLCRRFGSSYADPCPDVKASPHTFIYIDPLSMQSEELIQNSENP